MKKQGTNALTKAYTAKGITLIALIITIIVMLILVTVTISISLNGGLFGYAKRAVKETNQALSEEEMLANGMVKIDGVWYKSIDEYLKSPTITITPEADEGKWDYVHNGDGTITLTKYNGTETDLIVPNRYKIGEEYYIVTKVQSDKIEPVYSEQYKAYLPKDLNNICNIMGTTSDSKITSVKISDGVEVGIASFRKMDALKSVTIGKNITKIDSMAFQTNSNMEEIEIGPDVEEISLQAFRKCSKLKTIDLSKNESLKKIGRLAISACSSLEGTLVIPKNVQIISQQAFAEDKLLTGIDLSGAKSLETIGNSAFYNCTGLTGELVIPNNVNWIQTDAFTGCSKLTSLNLSNAISLEYIESDTFKDLKNISGDLVIPKNIKSIGSSAFKGFSKLTNLDLSNAVSLETIGSNAFSDCTGLKGTLVIPSKVKTIKYNAFGYCKGLTSLELSGATSLENIEGFVFNNCSGLTGKLVIPSSVKQIGVAAFQYCSKITSIELNEGLEYIGDFAFNHVSKNKDTIIKIPSTVKQIGGQEYKGDSNTYGSHMFYDCGNFQTFEVAEGNTAYKAVDGVLYNKAGTVLVAYPQGKTTNRYEIPEGVTKIDEMAFNRNQSLKTLVLPNSYEIKSTDEMPEEDYRLCVGNNLAIGIYRNTAIANIEVESTNTRYKSENGMVLSKDGTILYYIPVKNAGTGTIEIPSTVTKIYKGTLYGYRSDGTMTNYYTATKIVIPAGCVEIDETVYQVINQGTWTIEVASGNTKYEVGSDGKLATK